MYLLTQLAIILLLAFLVGVATGYGLWRLWGKRQLVAKYKAAEMRLASYMMRLANEGAAPEHRNYPNR